MAQDRGAVDPRGALRMGEEAEELPMARFNLPIIYSDWSADEGAHPPKMRGLLFTDRPLYRPGETVRVKGIMRRVANGGVKRGAVAGRSKRVRPEGASEVAASGVPVSTVAAVAA